jgi:Fe-Mn family superoxide dismutase
MPYPFKLPKLKYEYSALEPHIDTRTMGIHYEKHHGGYVAKLNAALENYPELQGKSLTELLMNLDAIPADIRTAVRNNGGGHANHSMFWSIMSPKGGGAPDGSLVEAINVSFGDFDSFRAAFKQAALGRFGSGWAWLVVTPQGELSIISTPNQDNPISQGLIPIMGLDVWEHAYYLNYQNRRGDYIDSWWYVVDWNAIGANYTALHIADNLAKAAQSVKETWSNFRKAWGM